MKIATVVLGALLAGFVHGATVEGLKQYGSLTLVDSIDCATERGCHFTQYPANRAKTETKLGSSCLTLAHVSENNSGAYVAWRLGEGKNLVPKAAYLLVVEYPDDAPRTMILGNRGTGSRTCVHTGFTVGDALYPPYVTQRPESYNVPLSGQFQRIEQVMYLMEKPESLDGSSRLTASKDGFDVYFALYAQKDSPDSVGLALKSVKLYKIDNPALLETAPVYPADGLPRRYVTWREEMADDGGYAAFSTPVDYYATKAKLMKVLGFNCASRDLLEFGACQYWDIWGSKYGWTWMWGVYDDSAQYWERTIEAFSNEGHYILPYYEYSGSLGGDDCLGYKTNCVPLYADTKANAAYSRASWVSKANVDLTSPLAITDFRKVLDCTVLRYKGKSNVKFRGAWLRNRAGMPVSFSDDAVGLFNDETSHNTTRAAIAKAGENSDLYKAYMAWWYGKRASFLENMRDYLRDNGVSGAEVFFDNDISEPGRIWTNWGGTVARDPQAKYNGKTWSDTVGSISWSANTLEDSANMWAQKGPMGKCPQDGVIENQHACPTEDPQTYTSRLGVGLALSCGKAYMQIASSTVSAFRNGDDRLFLAHHYSLNEDALVDANGARLLGYFTADTDKAGRASMLPQLWAMAINDPTDYGYLYGAAMESAAALAMREFNLNFLALPAKKGAVMQGGAWGQYQTVRRYDTDKSVTYWALINTSTEPVTAEFKLSNSTTEFKKVKASVDGTEYNVTNGKVSLTMKPLQLLALSSEVSAENPTLETIPDGAVTVKGFNGGYDGGENHRISVTIATGYNFNVEYSLSKDGPWSTTNPGRRDVGTTEVWYRVSADGYVPLVGSANVVVTKAGNRWTTEPAIAGWTEGETPSTPAGYPLFGNSTLVITYSGTTAKGESVSGASSVNAAGSYTAHFVVPDNTNWEGLSKDVNFTVAAAQGGGDEPVIDPPVVDPPSGEAAEFTWNFPEVGTAPTAEICTFLYGKTWAYSFEMDDNGSSAYTIAKPLFDKLQMTDGPTGVKGDRTLSMPGTLGIFAVALANGKDSVNITTNQLKEVVAAGWSVSNHGYWSTGNHWDASKANDEAMYRREFFWGQFFISQYVWDGKRACTSMVYPSGDPGYKTYFDDYGIIVGTLVGGTPQNVLAAHGSVRKVNWLDAGRTNLDNGDWKSNPLHNVPSDFVEGDWFIDFTHGISETYQDTYPAISNRLDHIYKTWGAKGADNVWLATSDRVAQYRKAAEAAQVTITKNKLTVTLPETVLQSALTLKISGIPKSVALTAPAGGSVYRDSADNVYLTTPVIGDNITKAATNLVKVHEAKISGIGANQIVPQEITFEKPVKFAGMRLRQFGDLPASGFDINLMLVKTDDSTVPFNFAKYDKYVKLDNAWGSWRLFPQLPDEEPILIKAIRYNAVQAFNQVEVWAVEGDDDPAVDPPTEPEEPPEEPAEQPNATMQAWFAYTAATEQVVGGAWQAETTDGIKVFLPTASSKDGDLVYVDVKAKFPAVAASKLPTSVSAQGALSAADGYLYVFAASGWTKLANATVAADTEKSYRVEFDYGSPPRLRVWEHGAADYTELKDANGTSWFALTANTYKHFTSLAFSGDGTIGDFIGTCETGPREVATIEIPSFKDKNGVVKGGVELRTVGGKNVFSVTIANGMKGAHYTAFVANTLTTDAKNWVAAAASVSPDADGLLTLDVIRDDSPEKFAKIVATPTAVKSGTKLSDIVQ